MNNLTVSTYFVGWSWIPINVLLISRILQINNFFQQPLIKIVSDQILLFLLIRTFDPIKIPRNSTFFLGFCLVENLFNYEVTTAMPSDFQKKSFISIVYQVLPRIAWRGHAHGDDHRGLGEKVHNYLPTLHKILLIFSDACFLGKLSLCLPFKDVACLVLRLLNVLKILFYTTFFWK